MLVMLYKSAAFDYVGQEQMMFLFEGEYGIQGRALTWFRSYLDRRKYRVQIDGASFECDLMWCGVPQGYVLGPILLTMYFVLMVRHVNVVPLWCGVPQGSVRGPILFTKCFVLMVRHLNVFHCGVGFHRVLYLDTFYLRCILY